MEYKPCKCIKDTTIPEIKVDSIYKYTTISNAYQVIYNETEVHYEVLNMNADYFNSHFIRE